MAQAPQEKSYPFQGLAISGDDVFIDSFAQQTGKPPLKKVSELLTGDQVLEKLEREFPDKPEDEAGPAPERASEASAG